MTTEIWNREEWVASLVASLSAVARLADDQSGDSLNYEETVHWLLTPAGTEDNDQAPALCGVDPRGWWNEQNDWKINVQDWCTTCFQRAAELVAADPEVSR